MPATSAEISGYRSVARCRFPIGQLTILVGRNGVGKTNLYRALRLIQSAADSSITREIVEDGGLQSVLYAGAGKHRPAASQITLSAQFDEFEYRIEIGYPLRNEHALGPEPRIKSEQLSIRIKQSKIMLLNREGSSALLRDVENCEQQHVNSLLPSETGLATFRDVGRYPALEHLRRELTAWRFYDHFDTSRGSPLRRSAVAVTTPMLAADGSDLAAVLATICRVKGDAQQLARAVDEAFPGAALDLSVDSGRVNLALSFRGQPRPYVAHELSDGTMRYLCLVGALCGYRLPTFIALNEPETSLHPELIPALAGLIARASKRTRIWVVTHSDALSSALGQLTSVQPWTVTIKEGATSVSLLQEPRKVGM